ncbi:unnamed protein product [Prunus brigantina]
MSDIESGFESGSESGEPNAYEGESSDGLFDTDSGVVAPDAEDGSDSEVEVLGECSGSAPSHGVGKGFMTAPAPLMIVYADGRQVGPIAKYRRQYLIPDSVRMRIPTPIESLSKPKDGEVVFFTDVLLQRVRLPLQPAVQKILAMIGYAPGQFNPNFWVALMGVVTAFGMAGQGEPSYEQFSHMYSVTRSKTTDHGGWVQANYLRAAERGHFVSHVPTSQKSWRNRRVLLSGDWESPPGSPVRFHIPTTFQMADADDQSLAERLRQMNSGSGQAGPAAPGPSPSRGAPAEGASSRAAGKRVLTVDLDAEPAAKRGRQSEVPRAIFSVEDNDDSTDLVNLACPSKAVQFANHMILGSQMELSDIEELPKKVLREEAGRAFRLQASASMDMWLLVKRALNAAERAKKAYEDGRAKKDLRAAERQVKSYEATFAEMTAALESAKLSAREALEAKEAVQVALEIEAAIRGYRRSSEFSVLLDSEVGEEMAGLIYRFKRYNPGKKLNLNFIADPPSLPEGITEEMIDEYEGEVVPEPETEEPTANATEEENEPPAVEEAA